MIKRGSFVFKKSFFGPEISEHWELGYSLQVAYFANCLGVKAYLFFSFLFDLSYIFVLNIVFKFHWASKLRTKFKYAKTRHVHKYNSLKWKKSESISYYKIDWRAFNVCTNYSLSNTRKDEKGQKTNSQATIVLQNGTVMNNSWMNFCLYLQDRIVPKIVEILRKKSCKKWFFHYISYSNGKQKKFGSGKGRIRKFNLKVSKVIQLWCVDFKWNEFGCIWLCKSEASFDSTPN